MFDWAYKRRLKDDLEAWVVKGWVSSEGAAAILKEQDQEDGRSRLPMALAGIGMVCVALALFAFIAANWDVIPKFLKLAGIAFLIVLSNALAAYASARGRKGVADLMTGFATLVFVGGLALVGQIFHLPADWASGAFLVSIGALAAAWLTGSKTSLIAAAVAVMTWQVGRSTDAAPGVFENLTGLVLLAAVFLHPVFFPARVSRWAGICVLWVTYGRWFFDRAEMGLPDEMVLAMGLAGFGGLAAVLVQLDTLADLVVKWSSERPSRGHGRWLMSRSMQDAGMLILCVMLVLALIVVPEISDDLSASGLLLIQAFLPLVIAVLLTVVGFVLSYKTAKARALFAAVGLALASIVIPVATGNILILASLSLAALVGLCALGTWYNNRSWMLYAYVGLTAVALWLLQVTIGSLLGQSLFFLVAGAVLLAMALWLARALRKRQTPPEPATEELPAPTESHS
ncbi:DUF2157 domain-containing protein [Roseibium aggregatum]|uniref:DUF2157 domain-containing protein n=1 Tax=Roseibium aggregatum TaxID=187304 RepID=A0A939J2W8_9HYPH|nr:DUF2157 domain-containing protein [Roseibium aggregatum]MBN9669540.1 DUF2157 domain-containing protein [Roseibium aggregatum]